MERDWTKTKEALEKFYEHEATFDRFCESLWETNPTQANKLADTWFGEQDRLKLEVGKAFAEATSDINGAHTATSVSIQFAEKMSGFINPVQGFGSKRDT